MAGHVPKRPAAAPVSASHTTQAVETAAARADAACRRPNGGHEAAAVASSPAVGPGAAIVATDARARWMQSVSGHAAAVDGPDPAMDRTTAGQSAVCTPLRVPGGTPSIVEGIPDVRASVRAVVGAAAAKLSPLTSTTRRGVHRVGVSIPSPIRAEEPKGVCLPFAPPPAAPLGIPAVSPQARSMDD